MIDTHACCVSTSLARITGTLHVTAAQVALLGSIIRPQRATTVALATVFQSSESLIRSRAEVDARLDSHGVRRSASVSQRAVVDRIRAAANVVPFLGLCQIDEVGAGRSAGWSWAGWGRRCAVRVRKWECCSRVGWQGCQRHVH